MHLMNILDMKIEYMGGPVSSNNIEIAIPLEIDPSYLIISRRDVTGKFIDLQEILLPQ